MVSVFKYVLGFEYPRMFLAFSYPDLLYYYLCSCEVLKKKREELLPLLAFGEEAEKWTGGVSGGQGEGVCDAGFVLVTSYLSFDWFCDECCSLKTLELLLFLF